MKWSIQVKNKAAALRKSGLSYGEISKNLGVAKSTLFEWISDIKRPGFITKAERLKHLERIRVLAAKAHHKKREQRLKIISDRIQREVQNYPLQDIRYFKSMLSMLYWAEGSKGRGTVRFANTDPELSRLFLTLLRKCYQIDETKLRARLHLHYYHNIRKTKKFWSDFLNIPEDRFGKIYIKRRNRSKRFRKNFAGICFIKYHSEDLRFELLETGKFIANRLVSVA